MLRLKTTPVRRLQNVYGVLARVNSTHVATPQVPEGWETAKPFEAIPGPKPLPFIGNAWRFLPGIGEYFNVDMTQIHHKFHDQYGKIVQFGGLFGIKNNVFLYDPEDVQTVFRNDGVWPHREGLRSLTHYINVTRKNESEGIRGTIVTQGAEWGKNRSKVNQHMLQPRVIQSYLGPINEVADDFLNKIPALRDPVSGEMPDDFSNELGKWTLESVTAIALDTRLGCLESTFKPNSEAQKMIHNVQIFSDSLYELELTQFVGIYLRTPAWTKLSRAMDYFLEICTKYINKSIERSKTLPPDHEPSVLERILARDSNPRTALSLALEMIASAIDTTSHAVGFLLYHLATNPDAQKKLHQEIDRVLPRDSKEPITTTHLNEMKYLKACIKESMRISPVIVVNLRTSTKDMVLQGHRVPKNTNLVMGNMLMSNQEQHFKHAASFIPERWIKDQTDKEMSYKKTHPYVFLPFGHGPRSCLGRRFAELEIAVLVTKLLRKYEVEWHHPPMRPSSKLINTCKSPLRFKMIDRK